MRRGLLTFLTLWIAVTWTFIWEPVQGATGYYLYYWKSTATTQVSKKLCSTPKCTVSVDGRYAWWFYVTAFNEEKESGRSDKIRIYRGVEKERVK